jgi:murE/murF fusion protein
MNLRALSRGVSLEWLVPGDADVTAIVTDSRKARPGALFFAREGWHVDSHAFIADAVASGASAVVVTKEQAEVLEPLRRAGIPTLMSSAEDRDLGLLAAAFYERPTHALKVVGVTGTNGKSSCTYIIEHLLRAAGERVAVIGTVNNRFEGMVRPTRNTTPDGLTIQSFAREVLDAGATCLVVEVSSHGAALGRVAGVEFDVAAFTNLTPEHLDYHGTMERYADAKAELFSTCLGASAEAGKRPVALVWSDDAWSWRMADAAAPHAVVRRVGTRDADIRIADIRDLGVDGSRVSFEEGAGSVEASVPLVGAFNVANAAVSLAAAASALDVDVASLAPSLATFGGVPGRLERVSAPGEPAVFVDYAHTPDAVARVGDTLQALRGGEATIVLGAGGDRDRSKRAPMAAAASQRAEHLVLTNDNPRSEAPEAILEALLQGVPEEKRGDVVVIPDRSHAIAYAVTSAKGPVLIAGKGHETTQTIGAVVYHLDDREEARRAVRARRTGQHPLDVPLLSGWSIQRIASAVAGRLVHEGARGPWGALTTDSRAVEPDGVFVAIRGDRFDGNNFANAAADSGAAVLIVERVPETVPPEANVIVVDDGVAALGRLASALLDNARSRCAGFMVIGITGSSGKTTVRALVAASIGERALATQGNFNNHIGLPLSVARLSARHRYAVLEMGANQPTDIQELAAIARPDVGVVTSIGLAHIEGFGGIDGVRAAKSGIAACGLDALVLPWDEREQPAWERASANARRVVTFGDVPGADVRVGRSGIYGPVRIGWESLEAVIPLPLPGAHNARNLAAAIAAYTLATGEPVDADVRARLAAIEVPGARLRESSVAGRLLIDDSYNANPSSMRAALDVLAGSPAPHVAVLGAMRELGEHSDALHREVGAYAAASGAHVVAFGDGARPIADGAGGDAEWFDEVEALARHLAEVAPRGASVLVKGSRGAALERLIPAIQASWEETD